MEIASDDLHGAGVGRTVAAETKGRWLTLTCEVLSVEYIQGSNPADAIQARQVPASAPLERFTPSTHAHDEAVSYFRVPCCRYVPGDLIGGAQDTKASVQWLPRRR